MQRKITKTAIRDMAVPASGQAWLYDTELHGFLVLCQASGRKTYMVRYKAPAGNWRKMTIGSCSELDPDVAREQARNVLAASRTGRDPAAELAKERQAPTLADLAERFLAEHASKLKHGTRRNYEILWRRHILPIMNKATRVADVRRLDVQRLHDALRKTPHNANRAL